MRRGNLKIIIIIKKTILKSNIRQIGLKAVLPAKMFTEPPSDKKAGHTDIVVGVGPHQQNMP